MLADNQVKTAPTLLKTKLNEIWKWLATPAIEPQSADSTDWYAGLCVDPHSFTDQLCKLQGALHPKAVPAAQEVPVVRQQPMVPQLPIESIATEFRSEPRG